MGWKYYVKGERIVKEGRHRFLIRAKDAAGNVEEKSAAFVIDHTAPEIIIKGARMENRMKRKASSCRIEGFRRFAGCRPCKWKRTEAGR